MEPLFSTLNGSAKLNIPCFLCCTTKSSPFRHSFLNFFLLKNRTITIEIEQKNVYKITLWDFYFKNVFILIGVLYLFYLKCYDCELFSRISQKYPLVDSFEFLLY